MADTHDLTELELFDYAESSFVNTAVLHFDEFFSPDDEDLVQDTTGLRHIKDGHIHCLADALYFWVKEGNATAVCPTFEAYMLVVIEIISIWMGENAAWSGLEYGPVREERPHTSLVVKRLFREATTPVNQWHNGARHPAFDRNNFMQVQSYSAWENRTDAEACQWPFRTARRRPAELPAGGHGNCPLMANRSAHLGCGGVGHAWSCSV